MNELDLYKRWLADAEATNRTYERILYVCLPDVLVVLAVYELTRDDSLCWEMVQAAGAAMGVVP